ncbi:hypothetical protein BC831DRAFT_220475 [Entophlyctis helioformis]|nr:hypothetical protein BC831DRAFT_220475 [Entophlyctis helioformis]
MGDEEGEIRCICGFPHDDGFTIQCERCFVWQHAVCVSITADTVPDQYLCELCDPRWLDVEKAVALQARRLRDARDKAARPAARSKAAATGSTTHATHAAGANTTTTTTTNTNAPSASASSAHPAHASFTASSAASAQASAAAATSAAGQTPAAAALAAHGSALGSVHGSAASALTGALDKIDKNSPRKRRDATSAAAASASGLPERDQKDAHPKKQKSRAKDRDSTASAQSHQHALSSAPAAGAPLSAHPSSASLLGAASTSASASASGPNAHTNLTPPRKRQRDPSDPYSNTADPHDTRPLISSAMRQSSSSSSLTASMLAHDGSTASFQRLASESSRMSLDEQAAYSRQPGGSGGMQGSAQYSAYDKDYSGLGGRGAGHSAYTGHDDDEAHFMGNSNNSANPSRHAEFMSTAKDRDPPTARQKSQSASAGAAAAGHPRATSPEPFIRMRRKVVNEAHIQFPSMYEAEYAAFVDGYADTTSLSIASLDLETHLSALVGSLKTTAVLYTRPAWDASVMGYDPKRPQPLVPGSSPQLAQSQHVADDERGGDAAVPDDARTDRDRTTDATVGAVDPVDPVGAIDAATSSGPATVQLAAGQESASDTHQPTDTAPDTTTATTATESATAPATTTAASVRQEPQPAQPTMPDLLAMKCTDLAQPSFAALPAPLDDGFESGARQMALFATAEIPPGAFVSEIKGSLIHDGLLDLKRRYISSVPNADGSGVVAPPFVFYHPFGGANVDVRAVHVDRSEKETADGRDEQRAGLEQDVQTTVMRLAVDARERGSRDGRFARFSCGGPHALAPNARLQTVLPPCPSTTACGCASSRHGISLRAARWCWISAVAAAVEASGLVSRARATQPASQRWQSPRQTSCRPTADAESLPPCSD